MRRFFTVILSAAVLGAFALPARAGLVTGSVSLDADLSTSTVYAGSVSGATPPQPPAVAFTNWSSWTVTNQSLPTYSKLTGELNISGLVKGETAKWTDAPFSLTFVIDDKTSASGLNTGVLGAVTFSGVLNGQLSKNAAGQVTSSLDIDWLGPTTQTLDLDHHIYTLSVSGYALTGTLPNANDLGKIQVDVHVRHNPEPASLVLAGLALPVVAAVALRRKKRSAQAPS